MELHRKSSYGMRREVKRGLPRGDARKGVALDKDKESRTENRMSKDDSNILFEVF